LDYQSVCFYVGCWECPFFINNGCDWERWIENFPSVRQEPKKGEWIKQNPTVDTEECSECGYNIIDEEFETPYCPWCGADMRGEQNE